MGTARPRRGCVSVAAGKSGPTGDLQETTGIEMQAQKRDRTCAESATGHAQKARPDMRNGATGHAQNTPPEHPRSRGSQLGFQGNMTRRGARAIKTLRRVRVMLRGSGPRVTLVTCNLWCVSSLISSRANRAWVSHRAHMRGRANCSSTDCQRLRCRRCPAGRRWRREYARKGLRCSTPLRRRWSLVP